MHNLKKREKVIISDWYFKRLCMKYFKAKLSNINFILFSTSRMSFWIKICFCMTNSIKLIYYRNLYFFLLFNVYFLHYEILANIKYNQHAKLYSRYICIQKGSIYIEQVFSWVFTLENYYFQIWIFSFLNCRKYAIKKCEYYSKANMC